MTAHFDSAGAMQSLCCADAIAQALNLSGFGHFRSRPFSTAALNKNALGSRPFSTSNVFLQFQIHRFRYVELVSNATGCSALFLEMWRSMTKCHKCEPSTQAVQHCVSQSNSGSRPKCLAARIASALELRLDRPQAHRQVGGRVDFYLYPLSFVMFQLAMLMVIFITGVTPAFTPKTLVACAGLVLHILAAPCILSTDRRIRIHL